MTTLKEMIEYAVLLFKKREEFDSRMVLTIINDEFGQEYSISKVSKTMKEMPLQRRRLNESERYEWYKKFGTWPYFVYSRKSQRDDERFTQNRINGKMARIHPRDRIDENIEECSVCPEWNECGGEISPCPRFPDLKKAPRRKVMRLEEFD